METTQSEWYRSLDAETKSAIRELQRLKPLWNLTAVFFVLLWACLGVLVMSESHWSLRLVGYVVMGMIIHGLGNFMHEGIHGNLFRNRHWDRWLGFLAGVPSLFPVSAYGINHLLHHKHTRTEQDPDEIVNITRNRTLLSLIFYAWFFAAWDFDREGRLALVGYRPASAVLAFSSSNQFATRPSE